MEKEVLLLRAALCDIFSNTSPSSTRGAFFGLLDMVTKMPRLPFLYKMNETLEQLWELCLRGWWCWV